MEQRQAALDAKNNPLGGQNQDQGQGDQGQGNQGDQTAKTDNTQEGAPEGNGKPAAKTENTKQGEAAKTATARPPLAYSTDDRQRMTRLAGEFERTVASLAALTT